MIVFHAFGKPQQGCMEGGSSAAQTVRTYGCYISSLEITIMHHILQRFHYQLELIL